MAEVLVAVPAPAVAPAPPHPKVTLTGESGSVTFDITDRETDMENLAAVAEQVDRPGGLPLLQQRGRALPAVSLNTVIGVDSYSSISIADRLAVLVNIADRFERCALAYSTLESGRALGGWRITDLAIRVLRRRHGDNEPTRARIRLGLTAASDILGPATVGMKTAGPTRKAAAPRRVVLRDGQTLLEVATAAYGDGSRWAEIAEANGIRDVRRSRLPTGRLLLVP